MMAISSTVGVDTGGDKASAWRFFCHVTAIRLALFMFTVFISLKLHGSHFIPNITALLTSVSSLESGTRKQASVVVTIAQQ